MMRERTVWMMTGLGIVLGIVIAIGRWVGEMF
jgi:hypothetical protein